MICGYAIADYQRQFLAFLSQSLLIFLAHCFFFVLTRPTKGNKSFPYHVKTSKVSLILVKPKDAPDTENFPHHQINQGYYYEWFILFANSFLKLNPNQGGNLEFGDYTTNIDFHDLFSIANTAEKYKQSNTLVSKCIDFLQRFWKFCFIDLIFFRNIILIQLLIHTINDSFKDTLLMRKIICPVYIFISG